MKANLSTGNTLITTMYVQWYPVKTAPDHNGPAFFVPKRPRVKTAPLQKRPRVKTALLPKRPRSMLIKQHANVNYVKNN